MVNPLSQLMEKGSTKVSVLGGAVGAGIDAISATRDERAFLGNLIDEYRPEIAKRMGLAEKQVTPEHFNQAFKENPVLSQAKSATRMSRIVRTTSSLVSGVTGVISGLAVSMLVRGTGGPNNKQNDVADIAGTISSIFAGMMSGRVTRQILHTRGRDTSLVDTAHGHIMVIKNKQQMGEPTDVADIFKVQLAVNPEVRKAIDQAYGKAFSAMTQDEQVKLVKDEFPAVYDANVEMARRINEGARPQGLLFADVEDVKAKAAEKKARNEDVARQEKTAPPAEGKKAPAVTSEMPLHESTAVPKLDDVASLPEDAKQRFLHSLQEGGPRSPLQQVQQRREQQNSAPLQR